MDASWNDSYTILRIKRKRTDEPLDALVIDSLKRKKSRGLEAEGGHGVFHFAETVEEDVWKDEAKTKEMKDRISNMARQTIPLRKTAAGQKGEGSPTRPASVVDDPSRRYAILPSRTTVKDVQQKPRSLLDRPIPTNAPPVVLSSQELKEHRRKAIQDQWTMYDAVPIGKEGKGGEGIALEEDPEMASFIPMLQDYLRVNEIEIRKEDSQRGGGGGGGGVKLGKGETGEDDYVWDVFIHRTMSLEAWNNLALLGSVTGLPEDDDYPSDESEIEDEADEDSNDENWYANDYPDEELDSDDDEKYDRR